MRLQTIYRAILLFADGFLPGQIYFLIAKHLHNRRLKPAAVQALLLP